MTQRAARLPTSPTGPTSPNFGARLRQEREKRNISIASIAQRTKILGALLEGLENEDVSRWPTGLYRRAFIRAYATAIGLDPEPVVKEFMARFPDPDDPPPAPPPTVAPPTPAPAPRPAAVRVNTPAIGAWFSPGSLVESVGLRAIAAAVDLFLLSVTGLALYAVLGAFWAPLAIATAVYYSGSILVLGNTPGVSLMADPRKRGRLYLTLVRRPERDADAA